MSSSIKRYHTPSPSRASSSSRTPKAPRVTAPARSPLLCTLPPTCHLPNRPTPLSDSRALEAHYATHHAHVCSSPGCGCVFPDARLLELHLTECHDPLAEIRRERGEKTFACLLSSCSRTFATPKARRLHLIAAHSYPKEYFFSVTNKGIGGLLRRWGEGASLLRGPWHPRDTEGNAEGDQDEESTSHARQSSSLQSDTDGYGDDNLTEGEEKFGPDSTSVPASAEQDGTTTMMDDGDGNEDAEVDALARDVSALGLVPSSVRFGRGGTAPSGRAGLATRSGRPASRHIGNLPDANHHQAALDNKPKDKDINMEVGESSVTQQHDDDDDDAEKTPPTRGRRGRGRASVDGAGRGGTRGTRGTGRARALPPMPPRGGFLLRGWRGPHPRGMIPMRARGGGAGV